MRVLVRGKSETITILRGVGITITSTTAYDPDTGLTAGLTITDTDDTTSAALLTAVAKGAASFSASGLVAGHNYTIQTGDGRTWPVLVESVSGTTCGTTTKAPFAITSGTVKGVESTITTTVPAAYTGRLLEIEYTLSDATVQQESVLIASRKLVDPITSEDILNRYPRLRNRAQGEAGFSAQIADVMARARAQFWGLGYVLDDVRAPALLKDFLIAEVSLLLIQAGYDIAATGDRAESIREFERWRDREYTMLQTAPNLWIDTNEDRVKDDSETGPVNGIQLMWRNRA